MYSPDKAIESSEDDCLNRTEYARTMARFICASNGDDGFVMSICSEWGNGKSSLVNLVKEQIDEISEDEKSIFSKVIRSILVKLQLSESSASLKRPKVIEFNPWYFSGDGDLNAHFFKELSKELNIKNGSRSDKKLAKKMMYYEQLFYATKSSNIAINGFISKFFIPVISILIAVQYFDKYPYLILLLSIFLLFYGLFSLFISGILSVPKRLSNFFEVRGKIREKSLLEFKEDLKKTLYKRKNNILVVIDDIDRLNQAEIRQIFQLVKLNADLPKIIYLLSFDREIVAKALDVEQDGYGLNYLEKIVQLPTVLPVISKEDIDSLLRERLNGFINKPESSKFDQQHMDTIYKELLPFFKNIRDINRYINILKFNFEVVKGEINLVDLFGITAIQVFTPKVYDAIKENRDLFLNNFYFILSTDKNLLATRYNSIINDLDSNFKDVLSIVLPILFPQIDSLTADHVFTGERVSSWRKEFRICSNDHFNTYFRFALSESGISQKQMKSIVCSFVNADGTFTQKIDNLYENKKIVKFLYLLIDYSDLIPEDKVGDLVFDLMKFNDSVQKENRLSSDIATYTLPLLNKLETQDDCFTVLNRIISELTNNLSLIVSIIDDLDDQQKRAFSSEIDETNLTISSAQLRELKYNVCSKIQEWACDGRLLYDEEFLFTLYKWKEWCSEGVVQEFIDNVLESDNDLIIFISKFYNQSALTSVSSPIDLGKLKEYVDLDVVASKITIYESNDIEKNQFEKDVIADFLKSMKSTINTNK
jgi:predicted KAP-like P-loop ATPase